MFVVGACAELVSLIHSPYTKTQKTVTPSHDADECALPWLQWFQISDLLNDRPNSENENKEDGTSN